VLQVALSSVESPVHLELGRSLAAQQGQLAALLLGIRRTNKTDDTVSNERAKVSTLSAGNVRRCEI